MPTTFHSRYKSVFHNLTTQLQQEWPGQAQPLQVWVPGCSSGETVLDLAHALNEYGIDFRMLGIDRSEHAIKTAKDGSSQTLWSGVVIDSNDAPTQARQVVKLLPKLSADVRANIHFTTHNLINTEPPQNPFHNQPQQYDLIVFTNVIQHLTHHAREVALLLLLNHLKPDGRILMGPMKGDGILPDEFLINFPRNIETEINAWMQAAWPEESVVPFRRTHAQLPHARDERKMLWDHALMPDRRFMAAQVTHRKLQNARAAV